jgi:hypothetical protein
MMGHKYDVVVPSARSWHPLLPSVALASVTDLTNVDEDENVRSKLTR